MIAVSTTANDTRTRQATTAPEERAGISHPPANEAVVAGNVSDGKNIVGVVEHHVERSSEVLLRKVSFTRRGNKCGLKMFQKTRLKVFVFPVKVVRAGGKVRQGHGTDGTEQKHVVHRLSPINNRDRIDTAPTGWQKAKLTESIKRAPR